MPEESPTRIIFVQVVERPARKLLLKRGEKAEDYFAYCEEVGCEVWDVLCGVKEALYEPVGLWLPAHLVPAGTSRYAQGVELPWITADYTGGCDLITLPPCRMMVFQGEPYDDAVFEDAIREVWKHIDRFDPTLYGYAGRRKPRRAFNWRRWATAATLKPCGGSHQPVELLTTAGNKPGCFIKIC